MSMVFTLGLTVFGTVSLCGVLAVELAPPSLSGTSHALTALAANGKFCCFRFPDSPTIPSYFWYQH